MLFCNIFLLIFFICSVAPVKGPEHSGEKKARTCYFGTAKKTRFETQPRPKSAVTRSKCSDKLTDLSSLANEKDGNLFGAPDKMALAIARHEGVYLDDDSDRSPWKDTFICDNHRKELLTRFTDAKYHHQKRNDDGELMCGFPEKGHTKSKAKPSLELNYHQSQYLLENKGLFLMPGTPMCPKHHQQMIGMSAESAHPSTLDLGGGEEEMEIDDDEDEEEDCDEEDDEDWDDGTSPNPLRSAFNLFAKEGKVCGVRAKKSWSKITNRDKNYRAHGLAQLVEFMLDFLADTADGVSELKRKLIAVLEGKAPSLDGEFVAHKVLEALAKHYEKTVNRHEKLWTLAPFTEIFSYPDVLEHIPGLSSRLWYEATKMRIDRDFFTPEERIVERYDYVKLVFFVNFLTSPHILIQLPFGDATVRDSHGHVYHVTNAVRQTGVYETIDMYIAYMKQNGMEDLLMSRTTMYKILTNLPIKKAVSMQCLDFYQADATNGFIAISGMIDELVTMGNLKKEDATQLKREFDEAKLYLKGNYRLRLKKESTFSDHCLFWALSDPDNEHFAVPASSHKHTHDRRCPDCIAIDNVIRDFKELLKQYSDKPGLSYNVQKKLDGFVHDFDLHAEKIIDLKAHYARAAYAAMEYKRIVGSLKKDEALLIFDYAQKVEETQYREGQLDYYGKHGNSLHVIKVYANISGKAVTHSMYHVMEEGEQNSTAVVSIAKHAFSQLEIMGIKLLHVRSDNAPYYHCSALVASLPSLSKKVKIASYSFSEKQAGKSGADVAIGTGKRKIFSYRDKQHKVLTPSDIFDALISPRQLRGASIYLGKFTEGEVSTTKIPKITGLGHFEYHGNDKARVWRFYMIGGGEMVEGLKPTDGELKVSKSGGKLASAKVNEQDRKIIANSIANPTQKEEPTFWMLPKETNPLYQEVNDRDDDIVTPNNPAPFNPAGAQYKSLFYCHCGASFILWANFLEHIDVGKHRILPEKIKICDRALGLYTRNVEQTLIPVPMSPVSEVCKEMKGVSAPALPKGWGIRLGKKAGRYPEMTKKFIKKQFDAFAGRGEKLYPDQAEKLMKGDAHIMPWEWMTKTQIRSYINTLKKEKPKMRVYRRALEPDAGEEEWDHEYHLEVEVHPQEEDLVFTMEDFLALFTIEYLKKAFKDVLNPIYRTLIPAGTTEFE